MLYSSATTDGRKRRRIERWFSQISRAVSVSVPRNRVGQADRGELNGVGILFKAIVSFNLPALIVFFRSVEKLEALPLPSPSPTQKREAV